MSDQKIEKAHQSRDVPLFGYSGSKGSDPLKNLAAAVVQTAYRDAVGPSVWPKTAKKLNQARRKQREARRWLRGSMMPWSELLDLDFDELRERIEGLLEDGK